MNNHDSVYGLSLAWILCFSLFLIICFTHITYCQSMTLHTELCTSLNISEALPHTLTHYIADSADCTTTILPPESAPPHVLCLVVFLFVYLCHWCMCCLLCLFISSSCCFQY